MYHDGSSWKLIGIVNRGAAGCPSHINYAVYLSVPAIQGGSIEFSGLRSFLLLLQVVLVIAYIPLKSIVERKYQKSILSLMESTVVLELLIQVNLQEMLLALKIQKTLQTFTKF